MSNEEKITSLFDFLNSSPTSWHSVKWISDRLKLNGFIELNENKRWNINSGNKYFTTRNGSSLFAFTIPKNKPTAIALAASHTDSPAFKLKPHCEWQQGNLTMIGTEVYGGVLLSSWLNRDLYIAGRVIVRKKDNQIYTFLVKLIDYPLTIPQLAVHLDRKVNKNGLLLNPQDHLNAIAALGFQSKDNCSYLETLLRQTYDFEEILGHDLFLVPKEQADFLGFHREMIATWRIDSLSSVHSIFEGFTSKVDVSSDKINGIVFWDNEEIGSSSVQGANSPFVQQSLERILPHLGCDKEDYYCMLADSLCLSVDQAHALHPNYQEKHDARHQPLLGKGITIKYSASQRYATDGIGASVIEELCRRHSIPYQKMVNRNDLPSGSTIGPIHATLTGMPTVDIGTPQLSMHSCRELMATEDHISMCRLIHAFFS